MDWRVKATLQGAFSRMPYGDRVNFLFQRYVTHSLPASDRVFIEAIQTARDHLGAFERNSAIAVDGATFLEFGAGWDLAVPMAMSSLGVTRQIVVDIRELTRTDLVAHTVERLRALAPELEIPAVPQLIPDTLADVRSVLQPYGIDYRAPCDIRSSGLPDGSVDCITSTSTFEHLPEPDIPRVLRECYRLLSRDGVLSSWIDYKDHYSYFDSTIGPFNFLRYSERSWPRYSPTLHHQNRLRHSDFVRMFGEAGFVIVEEETVDGGQDDLAAIDDLPPADRFARYSRTDLVVQDGRFVAKRKS